MDFCKKLPGPIFEQFDYHFKEHLRVKLQEFGKVLAFSFV